MAKLNSNENINNNNNNNVNKEEVKMKNLMKVAKEMLAAKVCGNQEQEEKLNNKMMRFTKASYFSALELMGYNVDTLFFEKGTKGTSKKDIIEVFVDCINAFNEEMFNTMLKAKEVCNEDYYRINTSYSLCTGIRTEEYNSDDFKAIMAIKGIMDGNITANNDKIIEFLSDKLDNGKFIRKKFTKKITTKLARLNKILDIVCSIGYSKVTPRKLQQVDQLEVNLFESAYHSADDANSNTSPVKIKEYAKLVNQESGLTRLGLDIAHVKIIIDEDANHLIAYNAFKNGIMIDNELFLFALQTPSGSRQGVFLFVKAPNELTKADAEEKVKWVIHNVWTKLTNLEFEYLVKETGLFKENNKGLGYETSIPKLMARLSLRASGSMKTSVIVENALYPQDEIKQSITNKYKSTKPGAMDLLEETSSKSMVIGDGQGFVSFRKMAEINRDLGLITNAEFDLFKILFDENDLTSLQELSVKKLVNKMSPIFQVRHGSSKGILVSMPIDATGIDFIIPPSMHKYNDGANPKQDGNPAIHSLDICRYLKRGSGYVTTNAQMLAALDLENENLKKIVDYHIDLLIKSMDSDENGAAAALELNKMSNANGMDDTGDENSDMTKYVGETELINANTDFRIEHGTIEKIKTNMLKKIAKMASGRFEVEGLYGFMVHDPNFLLTQYIGKELKDAGIYDYFNDFLNYGEVYIKGKAGCKTYLFRSPLISPCEAMKKNCVTKDYYWLHDCIIFNAFDGAWEGMGGADFDGDTCLAITNDGKLSSLLMYNSNGEETILDKFNYIIYSPKESNVNEIFMDNNMDIDVHSFCNRLTAMAKADRTGLITNYAATFLDIYRHLNALVKMAKNKGLDYINFVNPKTCTNNTLINSVINGFNVTDNAINTKYIVLPGDKDTPEQMHNLVLSGKRSIYDILDVANYCLMMNELLRPCQGTEIDGAKTGVYAVLLETMEIKLRSYHARFNTMLKTAYLNSGEDRKFFDNDNCVYATDSQVPNTYHSLSPLGYICRYCRSRGKKLLSSPKGFDNLKGRDMLKQLSFYNKDKMLPLYTLMVDSANEEKKIRLIDRIYEIKINYGKMVREVISEFEKIDEICNHYNSSIISKAYNGAIVEQLEELITKRKAKMKEVIECTISELLGLKEMLVENKPGFDPDIIALGCYVASYVNNTDNRKDSFAYLLNILPSVKRMDGLNLIRLPKSTSKDSKIIAVKGFVSINGHMTQIKCLKKFGQMETVVVDNAIFAIDDTVNTANPYSLSKGLDSENTAKIVLKPIKPIFNNKKLTEEQKEYNASVIADMIESVKSADNLFVDMDNDNFSKVTLFNNETPIAEVDFCKDGKLASENMINLTRMLAFMGKNIMVKSISAGKFGRMATAEIFVR